MRLNVGSSSSRVASFSFHVIRENCFPCLPSMPSRSPLQQSHRLKHQHIIAGPHIPPVTMSKSSPFYTCFQSLYFFFFFSSLNLIHPLKSNPNLILIPSTIAKPQARDTVK